MDITRRQMLTQSGTGLGMIGLHSLMANAQQKLPETKQINSPLTPRCIGSP